MLLAIERVIAVIGAEGVSYGIYSCQHSRYLLLMANASKTPNILNKLWNKKLSAF